MITGVTVFLSAMFLITINDLTDCLINLSALLILTDFDNIIGKVFMLHLKTYYFEMTNRDIFLKFDST